MKILFDDYKKVMHEIMDQTKKRNRKDLHFLLEENSLDYLRMFAAFQVALSHYLNLLIVQYGVNGWEDTALLSFKRCITLFPGVVILFSISGFLMAASMERGEDRKMFAIKRFRRIYPELWGCIIFMIILIAVLVPPNAEQWKELLIWGCVQGVGIAYTPAFLKGIATGSINGALWTVMVEVQFYVILFLFWNTLRRKDDRWWLHLLGVSFFLNLGIDWLSEQELLPKMFLSLLDRTVLPYLFWLVAGICLFRLRVKIIPFLRKWIWFLFPLYIVYKWCWQFWRWNVPGYYTDFVTSLILPGLIIGLGYTFGRHRIRRDLSYEIFLYHWPVINIIFYWDLPKYTNHMVLFVGYIAVFAGMAWISYWCHRGYKR